MSILQLAKDQSGLALVEYLLLLGFLIGAVVLSITTFGTALSTPWQGWSTFIARIAPAPTAGDAPPTFPDSSFPDTGTGNDPADQGRPQGACANAAANSQCSARNPNATGTIPRNGRNR